MILTFLRFTFSLNNKNHNNKEFIYTGNKISIKNNCVLHCSPVVIESIIKQFYTIKDKNRQINTKEIFFIHEQLMKVIVT